MTKLPRIAICGPSRCGKDTAARWFAANTPLRMGRTTSEVIAPAAAAYLDTSVEEAFARRHVDRQLWYDLGNEMRRDDPAFLARAVLEEGDIVVGIRSRGELLACRREGLVDLVVWIERGVPVDPTIEYGTELCDAVIANRGTLDQFHRHLAALARFAGLTYLDTVSR